MRFRKLGDSDIEASVVGFGAWAIGGWLWGGTEEKRSVEAIQAALDAGITLVDTAAVYGFGLSEELVGKAIQGRRDQVVLATKCGLVWNTDKGEEPFETEGKTVRRYLGPDSIRAEIEESLRRLDTDRIDLYQTHWQDSTTPVEDVMEVLLDLQQQGKIRTIGVSNCSRDRLEEYLRLGQVVSVQECYSMIDRGIEDELLPYCRDHNISALAYSPMALGLLTGKIGPDRTFGEGDLRNNNPRFSVENRERIANMLQAFEPVAQAHDATIAQTVIAWTAEQPGITFVLCGARNPQQARENAAAGDIVLTGDERATIGDAVEAYVRETSG